MRCRKTHLFIIIIIIIIDELFWQSNAKNNGFQRHVWFEFNYILLLLRPCPSSSSPSASSLVPLNPSFPPFSEKIKNLNEHIYFIKKTFEKFSLIKNLKSIRSSDWLTDWSTDGNCYHSTPFYSLAEAEEEKVKKERSCQRQTVKTDQVHN